MDKPYTPPTVKTLGSVQDLTEQLFNKIGSTPDGQSTNPAIVGSVTPI